jgi:hypothetical protein
MRFCPGSYMLSGSCQDVEHSDSAVTSARVASTTREGLDNAAECHPAEAEGASIHLPHMAHLQRMISGG